MEDTFQQKQQQEEILAQLKEQDEKIQKIYQSVEKTRKMILWSGVATLITFVLPFIILIFALPHALSLFSGGLDSMGKTSSIENTHFQQTESLSNLLNSLNSFSS